MRRFPYRVYKTQFHDGGLLSRHATEAAAERAARGFRVDGCTCGCAVVLGPDQPDPSPADEGRRKNASPYRAAS